MSGLIHCLLPSPKAPTSSMTSFLYCCPSKSLVLSGLQLVAVLCYSNLCAKYQQKEAAGTSFALCCCM